jgi:hypothetical protein
MKIVLKLFPTLIKPYNVKVNSYNIFQEMKTMLVKITEYFA